MKTFKKRFHISKIKTTHQKVVIWFVFIATTSSCVTLSINGNGLKGIPKTSGTACGLSICKKVIYEITMNKYNKHKKQFEKDQQTIKSFDKLYKKTSLEDNIIH